MAARDRAHFQRDRKGHDDDMTAQKCRGEACEVVKRDTQLSSGRSSVYTRLKGAYRMPALHEHAEFPRFEYNTTTLYRPEWSSGLSVP